jgi:hypothetical protein
MRLQPFVIGLLATALLGCAVVAGDKANFQGQWVMDKSKAEGLPPNMEQRMKVEQNGDDVRIETDLFQGDDVQTIPDHYLLDGREIEFPVKLPSGEETKGKRIAKWNEAGNGFEVRDVAIFETANGKVTITTVRKWALGADGKALVIEIHRTAPENETRSKRTFHRK